jgi:uncharacterized C2H2 Zn-finger protein
MSPGYTMELPEELPKGLPKCIKSWVIRRTGKRKYDCKLCHMEIGGTEQMRLHLSNWFHIKKVMQQTALHCDLCNLQCKYQSVYNTHIKSKAHLQKENPQPKPVIEHKCDDCKITFQSNKDKLRHLISKKHLQKEKPETIIEHKCEDCNIVFRCRTEKERHLTTKKHAKLAKTDSVSSTV